MELVNSFTDRIQYGVRSHDLLYWHAMLAEETESQVHDLSRTKERHLLARPLQIRHVTFDQYDLRETMTALMGRILTSRDKHADAMLRPKVEEHTVTSYTHTCTVSCSSPTADVHPNDNAPDHSTVGYNIGDDNIVDDETAHSFISLSPTPDSDYRVVCMQFSVFTDTGGNLPITTAVVSLDNGDIVVGDRNNKCINYFHEGSLYRKVHTTASIRGICGLGRDKLAICDHAVHLFDARGRVIQVLRQQPRDCHGVALTGNGLIVATDLTSRSVYVISLTSGAIKRLITQCGGLSFRSPTYVTCTANDDIIVSDTDAYTVIAMTSEGEFITRITSAGGVELNAPGGVCTDVRGRVLLCDTNNDRIVILDNNLEFIRAFTCNYLLNRPQAVTTNRQGRVVVCEADGMVKVINLNDDE